MPTHQVNRSAGDPGPLVAPDATSPPTGVSPRPLLGRVGPGQAIETQPGEPTIDPVAALSELVNGAGREAPVGGGLADRLLAYVTPRPRNPETLSAPRILPLLGLAASVLAHAAVPEEVLQLGSVALDQELRLHHMLAERRANQIEG